MIYVYWLQDWLQWLQIGGGCNQCVAIVTSAFRVVVTGKTQSWRGFARRCNHVTSVTTTFHYTYGEPLPRQDTTQHANPSQIAIVDLSQAAQPSPNWGKVPAFGEGLRPDIADRGLLLVIKPNPMTNKQSPLLGLADHQPDHRNALPDIAANGYADHLGDHQPQPWVPPALPLVTGTWTRNGSQYTGQQNNRFLPSLVRHGSGLAG